MALAATVGSISCTIVSYMLNMTYVFSNFGFTLGSINLILLHSHSVRMASFIFPVPDKFNFVAYHRVHHID